MNMLDKLREQRKAAFEARAAILDAATEEKRDLTEAELSDFDARSKAIKEFDERIAEIIDEEARATAAGDALAEAEGRGKADGKPTVRVKHEPMTYSRQDRSRSYFRDLGLAYVGGDSHARERLRRHGEEMGVELPKLEAKREAAFREFLDDAEFRGSDGASLVDIERRDISRTDGAGGEFVPPLWLLEEYAALARAGRPYADRVRNIPLPRGTDSINIPRITTGTAVAAQTADNAAVNEQDMVTTSVAAPVRTIAGQQDVALQLLEQSPIMFDEIVFADLMADYAIKLDAQVLNGSGSSGQVLGVLQTSGINAVTYTDASPTVPELYPKGADALNQVATNRLLPATDVFMHSRRWYWMTAALDSQSRPLVLPSANVPMNAQGVGSEVATEGPVGVWHGLRTSLDPNIPVNLGAGTNEDRIIAARMMDQLLFEGALRSRALPEVLSGNLTVRLQVYAYVAFTAGRYPAGISVISGTGLVTPTF